MPCLGCRNLGDVYGLPKMHYKGKQGDFYIMVYSQFTYKDLASSHEPYTCGAMCFVATLCKRLVPELSCSLQVMDLLGPSLWDAWNTQSIDMTPQYVACVAVEAIIILQALHDKG